MNAQYELAEFMGKGFESNKLLWDDRSLRQALAPYQGLVEWQRQDKESLYLYAHIAISEWRLPYLTFVQEVAPPPRSVLAYHDGVGGVGLQLGDGYELAFADYQTRLTKFLRWRLKQRKLKSPVYDIEKDDVPTHPLVMCFDSIQRYETDAQWGFVQQLATLGEMVVFNMDTRNFELDGFFYSVDVGGLLKQIRDSFDLVRHKVVNHYVNLIAFRTDARIDRVKETVEEQKDGSNGTHSHKKRVGADLERLRGVD